MTDQAVHNAAQTTAKVEAIHVAPDHGQTQQPVSAATLDATAGLIGDRHANPGGPAVVSLIEAEQVEYFNNTTGLGISGADTGRNILTRGVDLNALVGRRFRLGDAVLEGFELCDPCASLGRNLARNDVSAADVVRTFVDRAGLRATVVSSGEIEPGTVIDVEADA